MEKLSIPTFTFAARNYSLLTKPGIIFGNIVTMAGGFALASKGHFQIGLFLATLIGLSLIIASGCVFNNYIDREADQKMARTKKRALAMEMISSRRAIGFAILLGFSGSIILAAFTHLLSMWIALFGFLVYVFLYSLSKYRSVHGTLIGSVAGAVPPVVGYCAVSHRIDLGALILFGMIALWQMPHFFAIAIYRLDDYRSANIPTLPIVKGMKTTTIHMMIYIAAFIVASWLLTLCGYTGISYLIVAGLLGGGWLALCIRGFACKDDKRWARQMFLFSLIVIMGQSFMIPFSVVGN